MTACVRTCNVKYMRKRRLHLSATDPGRGTVPYKLSVAADAGDPLALALWSDIGLKLGVGLSNVVWLLNPHRIVIGGGVASRRATDRQDQEHDSGTYRENVLGEPRDRSGDIWQ